MRKIFLTILTIYTNSQTTCLRISQVGAASYFKVFLLSWGPCFYVQRFNFKVCQVTGAAFQSTYRNIQGAEQIYSVLPQFIKPHRALFWFADNDHFLLFELMDTVNTSLLQTMSSFFFTEAWRIACQSFWKFFFRNDLVDEFTDHRMLTGTDQIQVFAFDLVHHSIHLCEAHNTCYNIAADHERRYTISKASIDHEVTGICNNCRMKSCNISHQIVKAITCNTSCTVQINSVKAFHNICMIWNFKIRNYWFTEFFNFNIFTVVFTNRYRRINDVRDNHHIFKKLFFYFFFSCRKFINTCTGCSNLFLNFFCFITFSLCHQRTDLFGSFISFCSQSFNFLFDLSVFFVQFNNLINQFQFIVLEFVSDILFNDFRIFSHKFDV